MKKIFIYTIVLLLTSKVILAQQTKIPSAKGTIYFLQADSLVPLQGVLVRWQNSKSGVFTDKNGTFILPYNDKDEPKIVSSYVSFKTDTTEVTSLEINHKIILNLNNDLKGATIVARKISYGLSRLDPRTTVVLGEREFQKAACCNLSESFQTEPAIDALYSDAVTGTKQIQMLGLDGFYTLIGQEYMPAVRTLNGYYGLGHIPAAWVDDILITKGAGSVVNGFESIAGQINIELKKPFGKESFLLDQFVSEGGRYETDLMYKKDLNKNVSTSFFGRAALMTHSADRNNDGFLDMPNATDYKFMNRWQFNIPNKIEGIWSISYHENGFQTGQIDFLHNPENHYGVNNQSNNFELAGKIGKPFKKRAATSIGSQYNFTSTNQRTEFGTSLNPDIYDASSVQIYTNFMYESYLFNTNHMYKAGISFLYDDVSEDVDFSRYQFDFNRKEWVPGTFVEYTYKPKETFSIVGGIRADYNSIYGWSATPRFHSKYIFNQEKTSLRTSAGLGRRTSNPISQNQQMMISGRTIQFLNQRNGLAYGLEQEVAFNSGFSLDHKFKTGFTTHGITIDYFYTAFLNEVVMDREINQLVRIYNQENGTKAHSFQVQYDVKPFRRTEIRAAYRLFDVNTRYSDIGLFSEDLTLNRPFVSRHRGFVSITQSTRNQWQFSSITSINGPQRVAGLVDKQNELVSNYSQTFALINLHIAKTFRNVFELYIGVDNLANFRQENPIQNVENPFDQNFDAGLVWGPIFGRMIYGGFRLRIK